ncbi:amidohydrolase [Actinomadura hibisca]|uniref:amidohydrolase n=1 Tax=Actinomadura hibisca TaxID=68565 RepID=UPI001C3F2B1E|nr:amidohydrolase [Actinomadura hibisca]
MDPATPQVEALAISNGRIIAVGTSTEITPLQGPKTHLINTGTSCVIPGLIEAHGHFLGDATVQAGALVDIRPAITPTAAEVLAKIRQAIIDNGLTGTYCNGWDALIQKGLPEPTRPWLDDLAPHTPLVILHNSGHSAYFNTTAMCQAGLSRDTPDPPGGRLLRHPNGDLTGVALEPSAIALLTAPLRTAITPESATAALAAQSARVNAQGVTTMSEMAFTPTSRPLLAHARKTGAITTRLRLYEVSNPTLTSDVAPNTGDDLIRQIGVKIWADGSPWTGNLAATFPYLDTPATQSLGIPPGHRDTPNYTHQELLDLSRAYFTAGWQLACHANGDEAAELVLSAWSAMLKNQLPPGRHPRLRMEHVSAMRPEQFTRAHALGITCSLFPDHIYYWGEVIANDLFGPEIAARWSPVATALQTGMRVSLHNDSPVTPLAPLHNISVAATRLSRAGNHYGPSERLSVTQALKAQTIDAAWQLQAEDIIGSLTPGKYADLTILSANPLETPPEEIAALKIEATFLSGHQVHGQPL